MMRRERKREETERRFLTRQQGLRERRQRKHNSLPGDLPVMTGSDPAASDNRVSQLGRCETQRSPLESRGAQVAGTFSGMK
jgi:hypothetical protein